MTIIIVEEYVIRWCCENFRKERCCHSVPANPDAVVAAVVGEMHGTPTPGVGTPIYTQVQSVVSTTIRCYT